MTLKAGARAGSKLFTCGRVLVGLRDQRRACLMQTKVESIAGEDKEAGLDVEACGVVVVVMVLEGELRCVCAAASNKQRI